MVRTLVTGRTGFVGPRIDDELLDGAHEVTIIDNLISTGTRHELHPRIAFCNGDMAADDRRAQGVA